MTLDITLVGGALTAARGAREIVLAKRHWERATLATGPRDDAIIEASSS